MRQSVRSVKGNQWMFRVGHPADHPLRILPELLRRGDNGLFPILGKNAGAYGPFAQPWSDIFFLGMDFPRGRGC